NNDDIEIDEINNEDAIDEIECRLFEVKSPLVFESLDVGSANSEDMPNFPSEEFGDFMKLVIKWNLSDSCASEILRFSKKIAHDNIILPTSIQQGKQCLDKIMVQHISFKKVPIVEYE
ncbi:5958_t:CDS:2, partial [Cetraspora pellucida]